MRKPLYPILNQENLLHRLDPHILPPSAHHICLHLCGVRSGVEGAQTKLPNPLDNPLHANNPRLLAAKIPYAAQPMVHPHLDLHSNFQHGPNDLLLRFPNLCHLVSHSRTSF